LRTQSSDTPPDVERVQIEGLRRLTPTQRLGLAAMLTHSTFALSMRGFRRLHPELREQELSILWCRLLYGAELAEKVAAFLANRQK
jgi:hypothetical protein